MSGKPKGLEDSIRSAASRLLPVSCALALCAQAQQTAPSPALLRAVEEFRTETAQLTVDSLSIDSSGGVRPAWHGRIYENFRNNFLDAIPHEIVQRDGQQRKLRRNQFGFNVTGPVFLPKLYNGTGKTFFTLSFEGMRESVGQAQLLTIPTMRERTGLWSHVVDGAGNPLPIFDPATTAPNPNYDPNRSVSIDNPQYNRRQFPENTIPESRLDPAAQAVLQYYPAPNTDAGPFFRNNYFVVSQQINRATGFIATIDHTFREKQRVTVRLNYSQGENGSAAVFPTLADSAQAPVDAGSRGIRVEHIYTASPTNINTFRVQADSNRFANQLLLDEAGRPFPRYEIEGYQNMGRNNPVTRDVQNTFRLRDEFSTRWRTHRLTVGVDMAQFWVHTFRPQFPEGRFQFTAGLTSVPGVINTGHAFASFLLGGASFAQRRLSTSPSYFRWGQYRHTVADQWQISPSLTFNIGANFEIRTGRVEKYNHQSNVSFDEINPENGRPGALVIAGQDGRGRAFQPNWTKLEPYAGIAWSVLGDNNTVLRLNYERRYDGFRTDFSQFGTQAFNGSPTWLSSNPQLAPALILANGLTTDQTFPDVRPVSANGTVVDYVNTSKQQPTRQGFSASLQRQLAPFLILTVTAGHENARDQLIGSWAVNPNAIPLSALSYRDQLNDLEFATALRPYPQYQNFDVSNIYPDGRFKYNWLRFQLEKRTSGGLAVNFSYQYARRRDDFSGNVQDFYNRRNEWAVSSFTNPHEITFNYIYELPIGPNQAFLNFTDWRRYIAGGWAVSGVTTIRSGRPIQLQAQFNNTGGVVQNLRASMVPGVDPHVDDRGPQMWFNPAAFVQPDDFTLGDTPRIHPTLRNPWFSNSDLNVNKRLSVGGDRTLEFMASLFNFTNHGNWNDPDNQIGPASAPNANAGKIIGSTGGRIVQLGLRMNF